MQCPSCGARLGEQSLFCPSCGTKVAPPAARNQAVVPPPDSPPLRPISQSGFGSRLNGMAKGSYNRSSGWANAMFPAPQATRPVNPYVAAGLELLGFIGLLGIGRMYAGDVSGGIGLMAKWFLTLVGVCLVVGATGGVAAICAIFTFGISLMIWAVTVIPLLLPLLLVPITSAGKLFMQLKRVQ
ncbi:MAG: zinc-ribbon domain-containing protein [Herpetosiphonaceae bacterium]|nr:zinc-ribbon domain-containing protein [Herpetosiphonaceae bacterium]